MRSVFDPFQVDLSRGNGKRERDVMTEKKRNRDERGGGIGGRMRQIRAPLCEKPFRSRYRRTEGESNFRGMAKGREERRNNGGASGGQG